MLIVKELCFHCNIVRESRCDLLHNCGTFGKLRQAQVLQRFCARDLIASNLLHKTFVKPELALLYWCAAFIAVACIG